MFFDTSATDFVHFSLMFEIYFVSLHHQKTIKMQRL